MDTLAQIRLKTSFESSLVSVKTKFSAAVELDSSMSPLGSFRRNCRAASVGSTLSMNLLDVLDIPTSEFRSDPVSVIRRNILMLVNRGNYIQARKYLGNFPNSNNRKT